MRGIRLLVIVAISLLVHAGLAMAWIFNQPKFPQPEEPISIAMLSFAEPASTPPAETQSEPEPVVEPEPIIEPEPVVEPAIVLPQKKPVVKKKPEPKKEHKKEPKKIQEPVKPVEKQLAMNKTPATNTDILSKDTVNTRGAETTAKNNAPVSSQSSGSRGPKALSKQAPDYPDRARRLGKNGYVKVRYDIDDDGRVQNIEFVEASPKGLFERDVKRAMNRWKYEKLPAKGYTTEIYFKVDGTVSQV
ncbi:TPA: TonB family protein [Providencia alcalifaciens]